MACNVFVCVNNELFIDVLDGHDIGIFLCGEVGSEKERCKNSYAFQYHTCTHAGTHLKIFIRRHNRIERKAILRKQRSLKIIPVCNCGHKGYTINHLIKRLKIDRRQTIAIPTTTNFFKSQIPKQSKHRMHFSFLFFLLFFIFFSIKLSVRY